MQQFKSTKNYTRGERPRPAHTPTAISDAGRDAVKALPTHSGGQPQSLAEIQVRDGRSPLCVKLDRIAENHVARGTPWSEFASVFGAMKFRARVLFGAIPDATDLRAAFVREEASNAALNAMQWSACDPYQRTDAEIAEMKAKVRAQIETSADLLLALEVEEHQRTVNRDAARRRLSA
jgi:hypothetical protein